MSQASCLYEGVVRHRRAQPPREFRHKVTLAYLDLDELPGLLGGRLTAPGAGICRFRRADYLGDPAVPLREAVAELVQARTGRRPQGPIRVLAGLRAFGTCFNPVAFYYCLDAEAAQLETLVAEVTNTPWGERHAYVIPRGSGEFAKDLHVSPFLGMDLVYGCRAGMPGEGLSVHVHSERAGERVFDATLSLRRRELTPRTLAAGALRMAGARVLALIYARALGLRLAGVPVFPHPRRATA